MVSFPAQPVAVVTNLAVAAFIDWARSQVETYSEIFRNQVYSSGVEGKVVEEALQITYDLSKKVIILCNYLIFHH